MASRWVDSGIDWANLDLHKERTSWVIDELYRAFKEREQMLLYYTDKIGSISPWDLNAGIRDANKLDEIMLGLQTWLNSLTNNYSRFFDSSSSPDGQSITTGFLNGLPYYDSTIGGSLELQVGVSLDQIRNWDVTAQRLNSDLLQMIYLVLIELKEIISVVKSSPFFPIQPSNNAWDGSSELWDGSGVDFASADSDYTSDLGSSGNSTGGQLENSFTGATNYDLLHRNSKLVNDNFLNSSNIPISSADLLIKGFNYTEKESGGDDEFTELTYDVFQLSNGVGGEIIVFNETHPFSFTEITVQGDSQTAVIKTYPIVNVDDLDAILYYTP